MVDEVEELALNILAAGRSERRRRIFVAASGEAAEVVGEQMRGDVLDRPAGADGGRVPLGGGEGGKEFEEGLSLFGEEVEGEDGFEALQRACSLRKVQKRTPLTRSTSSTTILKPRCWYNGTFFWFGVSR